jgi:hypothetical protein
VLPMKPDEPRPAAGNQLVTRVHREGIGGNDRDDRKCLVPNILNDPSHFVTQLFLFSF